MICSRVVVVVVVCRPIQHMRGVMCRLSMIWRGVMQLRSMNGRVIVCRHVPHGCVVMQLLSMKWRVVVPLLV